MKRKDFLKTGMAAGLGSLFQPLLNRKSPSPVTGKARNIIFFSYDGFTWEDFSSAQHYSHRIFGKPLHLERLFKTGSAGSMMSHSLTSMVTDSAAATSAWATGRKIVNGSLSVYPKGQELTTILELAKAEGKATGVVSTTTVTHATPAGWIAKHINRRDEENIAEQYANFKADVMIGGGTEAFDAAKRSDGKDLYKPFLEAGYEVLTEHHKLAGSHSNKLLATFCEGHISYEIDRKFRGSDSPTLKEMAQKGIEILNGSENGFFVHIEAGRIDHANHRNDAGAALWEILAADETLDMLMAFVDKNPETLLIMASDHATGGGTVYGVGERYRTSSKIHELLSKRTASFDWILSQLGNFPPEGLIKDLIEDATGVFVNYSQASMLKEAISGHISMPDPAAYPRQPIATLAYILKGGTNNNPTHLNINYTTTQHTAGAVPIAVYGNRVEVKPFGLVDNTDLFYWMTDAIGVHFENPEMPTDEAW